MSTGKRSVTIELPEELADRVEKRMFEEQLDVNDLYTSMLRVAMEKYRLDEKMGALSDKLDRVDEISQRLDNYIVRANLALNEFSRFLIPDEGQYQEFREIIRARMELYENDKTL